MRKVIVGLMAALSFVALPALGSSTHVLAATHHHRNIISQEHKRSTTGPWIITEANGFNYSVGANNLNAQTLAIETTPGRPMTVTTTGSGYKSGTTEYIQFSNGNYLAASDNCNVVEVKSSKTSEGVVWVMFNVGDGTHVWLVNRYCDEPPHGAGDADEALSGSNSLGSAFFIDPIGSGGAYAKFLIHSP